MFTPVPPKDPPSDPLEERAREAREWDVAWRTFSVGMSYLIVTGVFTYCQFEVFHLIKGEAAMFGWLGTWLIWMVMAVPTGIAILTFLSLYRLYGWRSATVTAAGMVLIVAGLLCAHDGRRFILAVLILWALPWVVLPVIARAVRPPATYGAHELPPGGGL
jgi:hypothetical protein